ncbi:class 3 lipase, putative [Leishmania tarentolae]|uniref:Class 3 lipase, putative n=1 Tax=Leishmania tarentolae TaxID=5689 RepID=A0A640KCK1_LEITA|nr:class 3 lipase, putative [Leishmania tarentolae]
MHSALPPSCLAVPQPQWPQFVQMRDFVYTHTQPQWGSVCIATEGDTLLAQPGAQTDNVQCRNQDATDTWTPIIVRPVPLEGHRVCTGCQRAKEACTCTTCVVCRCRFHANRHHCRRCWHAVCSGCWGYRHYVHMLGRQMVVCDRCSTLWALANLATRGDDGPLWGLYILQIGGGMPRMCIGPSCRILTRRLVCYGCGLPTVVTQPHTARVVRPNGVSKSVMDDVSVLDVQQLSLRAMEVSGMTTTHMESMFRGLFRRYEELLAFRAITSTVLAQRVLLSMVASAIAYEYLGAPNITLSLSDIPYARALRLTMARERYTILEAPGRVKFIAFPGTHNWRTRWVDMQFARVTETVWSTLHGGVCLTRTPEAPEGADYTEAALTLNGGVRKVWEYQVHKGFAQEAQEVGLPIDTLLEDVGSGGYTLVLCGHSLGGATAQYLSLQLLHRRASLLVPHGSEESPRLLCVSLGAPLLGNYELADHVQSCGWTHIFHNFVYRSDIVPRLSCTDELAWDAQSRLTQFVTSPLTAAQGWWRGSHGSSPASVASPAATAVAVSPSETVAANAPAPRSGGLSTVLARLRVKTTPGAAFADASPGAGASATSACVPTNDAMGRGTAAPEENDISDDSSALWAEQAQLAAYVDTTLRNSHDALENDTSAPSHDTAAQLDADVEAALHNFKRQCARTSGAASRHLSATHHACREGDGAVPHADDASVTPCRIGVAADTGADVVLPLPSRRVHRRFTCFGRYHFLQYGSYGYVSTDDSETAFAVLKHGCGEASVLGDHSVEAYNRGVMMHLYRNTES